jgi:hypothetical protein
MREVLIVIDPEWQEVMDKLEEQGLLDNAQMLIEWVKLFEELQTHHKEHQQLLDRLIEKEEKLLEQEATLKRIIRVFLDGGSVAAA